MAGDLNFMTDSQCLRVVEILTWNLGGVERETDADDVVVIWGWGGAYTCTIGASVGLWGLKHPVSWYYCLFYTHTGHANLKSSSIILNQLHLGICIKTRNSPNQIWTGLKLLSKEEALLKGFNETDCFLTARVQEKLSRLFESLFSVSFPALTSFTKLPQATIQTLNNRITPEI